MTATNPSIPETHTALVQHEGGKLKVTPNLPIPKIEPHQILVKTVAVALNPCDYKLPEEFPAPGTYDGNDFSGVVVACGSEVAANGLFMENDRVFGAVYGSNPIEKDTGSFAEYVKSIAVFTWKIPDWMSFEDAAGMSGTCIATMGVALFRSLELPGTFDQPADKAMDVLVYGGSSSVGTIGIQMVKLLGHRAITTCSPMNFELVKSYGADAVFDYSSPTCAREIKQLTRNSLKYAIDPFAELKTMNICDESIGRVGGRYTALELFRGDTPQVKRIRRNLVMGPTILGAGVDAGQEGSDYAKNADPELRQWGIGFYQRVQRLVNEQKLRVHPIRVLEGRFDAILQGLDMLKRRVISGQKLVVRL
ncbi:MAG: hypothetical protein Q9201_002412 [Fulgogasparrea decipioides]